MTQKTQCISLELLMWNQQSRERSYNFTTLRYDNEYLFHAYCTCIKCQIICNSNNSSIIYTYSQHSGLILAFQVLPSHFYNFLSKFVIPECWTRMSDHQLFTAVQELDVRVHFVSLIVV